MKANLLERKDRSMNKSALLASLISLLLMIASPSSVLQTVEAATLHHWQLYKNGEAHLRQGKLKQAIAELEQAVSQSEQAGYLRKLAEAYEQSKQYQKAADTYYREARIHKVLGDQSGDLNTYYAVLAKADALNTEIEVYVESPATQGTAGAASTVTGGRELAKFEPPSGMYIGAYIDKDSHMVKLGDDKFKAFNKLAGKQHAIYFTYHRYGSPFPYHWAEQVGQAGGAIQLAFQPDNGLDEVKDGPYLRQFARDAKAAGVPVFLRFASEMNGNWVKWNGNPQQYIQTFRLVAKVMREEADNIAMVWSPAANPKPTIQAYYPGDEWVDWVGLSIYSVKYFNGKLGSPADQVNPLDSLDEVYQTYSARKPIMVSEYAATHYSKAGDTSTLYFAQTKMNMLYHGAKLKYPRLKAISWFSLNTLTDSHRAERSLNNFSLTENDKVLAAYSKLIADPYYLSSVLPASAARPSTNSSGSSATAESDTSRQPAAGQSAASAASTAAIVQRDYPYTLRRLTATKLEQPTTVIVWVKTYDPYISKVVIKLNGKLALSRQQYPYSFKLDPSKLPAGDQKLEVIVFDSKGVEASRRSFTLRTG